MGLNFRKFKADLEREFKLTVHQAINKIDRRDMQKIGDAAIDEMKNLISKGISPIAGEGRFDAYKWVGKANAANKIARSLSKDRRKSARQIAKEVKKKGYPYSVRKDFPDKRERPVNLYLSGDFLKNLKATPLLSGVKIGFSDSLSSKKEQGHREGVNGQPQRPIIPNRDEEFNPSIYRRIVDTVVEVLRKKFRT